MGRIVAGLLLCFLPLRCTSPAIWTGISAKQQIVWTVSDLTVQPAQFSFRAVVDRGFQAYKQAIREAELKGCSYQRSLTLLSVAGPIVSFRDETMTTCPGAAHPGGGHRVTAIDLSRKGTVRYVESGGDVPTVDPDKPGLAVSLSDLFPAASILTALSEDSILKPALGGKPDSLKDLAESLDDTPLDIPKNPCQFNLPKDYLTRFSFHHLDAGKVAVRIALDPIGGACRNADAQLGILLPLPPALVDPLTRAARGTEGFLSSTPKRPSGNHKTVIRLNTN